MKRNRLLRQSIVHGVGPVHADRQSRGCRHDHDRRGGPDDGLYRANLPVPGTPDISPVPEMLKMPEMP